MQVEEKVTPLRPEKEQVGQEQPIAQEIISDVRKDMGKVSMAISLLAVLLLVVFFFGLKQNVAGLEETVNTKLQVVADLQNQIQSLDGKIGSVEEKVAALENLPEKTKKMILANMLQEMSQKAAYLSSQVGSEEQSARLKQAVKLLQQVQGDLAQ
jgi:phage-related protein